MMLKGLKDDNISVEFFQTSCLSDFLGHPYSTELFEYSSKVRYFPDFISNFDIIGRHLVAPNVYFQALSFSISNYSVTTSTTSFSISSALLSLAQLSEFNNVHQTDGQNSYSVFDDIYEEKLLSSNCPNITQSQLWIIIISSFSFLSGTILSVFVYYCWQIYAERKASEIKQEEEELAQEESDLTYQFFSKP